MWFLRYYTQRLDSVSTGLCRSCFKILPVVVLFFGIWINSFAIAASSNRAIYNLNRNSRLHHIDCVEYPLKRKIDTIFAVPEKNAIGTNALDNAITLLRFKNYKIEYEIVSKDFMEDIYGGKMVFLPEFSKDTIGYSQTRGFLLFNIKDKTFKDYTIGKILQIDIDNVFPINDEKKQFLFQLEYLLGMTHKIMVLKLIELSTDEPKELASYEIEKDPLWVQLGKTSFHFTEYEGKRKLHALNERLRAVDHPLCLIYNNKDLYRDCGLPVVHPNLPFAVFIEESANPSKRFIVWVASWRDNQKKPVLYKIFSNKLSGQYQFSPDGKCFIFSDSSVKPRSYIAMPVDLSLEHYLGSPVLLKCNEEISMSMYQSGKTAWIRNPLSFVATFGDKLIKWDISKDNMR